MERTGYYCAWVGTFRTESAVRSRSGIFNENPLYYL